MTYFRAAPSTDGSSKISSLIAAGVAWFLVATDLDRSALITAAINEVEIEQAFQLDPLIERPLAVCGFGAHTSAKHTVEPDPLGVVWDEHGQRR